MQVESEKNRIARVSLALLAAGNLLACSTLNPEKSCYQFSGVYNANPDVTITGQRGGDEITDTGKECFPIQAEIVTSNLRCRERITRSNGSITAIYPVFMSIPLNKTYYLVANTCEIHEVKENTAS